MIITISLVKIIRPMIHKIEILNKLPIKGDIETNEHKSLYKINSLNLLSPKSPHSIFSREEIGTCKITISPKITYISEIGDTRWKVSNPAIRTRLKAEANFREVTKAVL